jgi:hypothetical protein
VEEEAEDFVVEVEVEQEVIELLVLVQHLYKVQH